MNNKLKPCPFCGGEAKYITYYPFDGYQRESPTYIIKCEECGAEVNDNKKESVIELWNRRVNEIE